MKKKKKEGSLHFSSFFLLPLSTNFYEMFVLPLRAFCRLIVVDFVDVVVVVVILHIGLDYGFTFLLLLGFLSC